MSILGMPEDQRAAWTPSDDGESLTGYLDYLQDSSGHPLQARLRPKDDGRLWQAEAFDSEGMPVLESPCVRVSQSDAFHDMVRRLRPNYSASLGRPVVWMRRIVRAGWLLTILSVVLKAASFLAQVFGNGVPWP